MTDELASLVVAVDSTSAAAAVSNLDRLEASGARVESAITGMGEAARKANTDLGSLTFSPTRLYSANQSLNEYKKNIQASAAVAAQAAPGLSFKTLSNTQLLRANQSLVQWRMTAQQAISTNAQLASSNKVVAASHHQVSKAAVGYVKSQKELAFATRNLPAQFTDIAISLQAGQNPLTVLLQQGGQLKDMFGGVGPAARAMAGYIKGLITPTLGAVAAVGALTVAFFKGDAESAKFQKTLAAQGYSLGATASSLNIAAESMETFNVSQGRAAEVLTEVAASGRFFNDQIKMVAQTAIDLERTVGTAIGETIDQFVELSKSPAEASAKLNEEFGYLTISTYEQIRALERQGDTVGASTLAMQEYANAVADRTRDVEENLGLLETAWHGITGAAKSAWDAMLDIGRQDTASDQLKDLTDKLFAARKELSRFDPGSDQANFIEKRIREIKSEYAKIADVYVEEQRRANNEQLMRQGQAAAVALSREAEQYRTNSEKRVQEIARVQKQANDAISNLTMANSQDLVEETRRIREAEAAAIAGITKRYADKPSEADKSAKRLLQERAREYERLTTSIAEHIAVLQEQANSEDKLSATQRLAAKTIAEMDSEYSNLLPSQRAVIQASLEEALALDEANRAREKQNKLLEINADINARIATEEARRRTEHARDVRGIGHGRDTNELLGRMDQIVDNAAQKRYDLADKYGDLNAQNTQEYLQQLEAINQAEQRQLDNEVRYYEERKAAMSDWRNGARSALEDIASEVNDVAGQTRDGFLNAFSAMQRAVAEFSRTGKANIREFATVVIAELLRIMLTIQLSKALTAMFSSPTAAPGSAGEAAAYDSWFNANGGSGMGFSGAQASTSGLNIGMSGAAPSSVFGGLLQSRSAPRRVASPGGAGAGMATVNTYVTINSDGSADSRVDASGVTARDAKFLGDALNVKIRQFFIEESRQGGMLWNRQNGRS